MVQAHILFGKEAGSAISESPKAPTVYTGQRVRGAIRIYQDESLGPMFDTVQLVLKGQVSNNINLGGMCWKIEKPLVRMSCVKILEDFERKSSDSSNLASYQTSFFFDIPEFITLPSLQGRDTKEASQPLPPSIRVAKKASNEWRSGKTSGICDVTYHIEARFFKDRRLVTDTRREILLMPVSELPPPMDPEDLQKEYVLSAATTFASFWKRKRGTILFGASTEPRPFVLQATTRKSLIPGTDLMFNFSTRSIVESRAATSFSEPQFTSCEIIMTLEATTYFQEHEQDSVMTLAEARKTQLAVLKTARFEPQTRKMRLDSWRKVGQVTSGSNRLVEWNTTTSVKALIPLDAPRLPSFFSTLVSRRYAFDVEIRFGTELGIRAQKPMRLRIPVQMVHAGLEKGWGGPPDADFEDDPKVPAYVP